MSTLNVAEIFRSIDGEVNIFGQGRQTVFLRLAKCNLSCSYCDTKQFQSADSGSIMTIQEVASKLFEMKSINLTITGGEPLLQKDSIRYLLSLPQMCNFKNISIETNGSLKIFPGYVRDTLKKYSFGRKISFVVDWKLSKSALMNRENWYHVDDTDIYKMVIANNNELTKAILFYREIREINKIVKIAFSPIYNSNISDYTQNAHLIIDELHLRSISDVILNLQLHKLIDMR